MRRDRGAGGIGALLAAASILVAPFIALLYRPEAGLVVMAVALGAVSFILHDAIRAAPPQVRPRLRLLLACNIFLTTSCMAAAAWLLLRDR